VIDVVRTAPHRQKRMMSCGHRMKQWTRFSSLLLSYVSLLSLLLHLYRKSTVKLLRLSLDRPTRNSQIQNWFQRLLLLLLRTRPCGRWKPSISSCDDDASFLASHRWSASRQNDFSAGVIGYWTVIPANDRDSCVVRDSAVDQLGWVGVQTAPLESESLGRTESC
jgi:hypothetical protein